MKMAPSSSITFARRKLQLPLYLDCELRLSRLLQEGGKVAAHGPKYEYVLGENIHQGVCISQDEVEIVSK
jgi:hypothetical protein